MPCENQVGVKNIIITFLDCETDERYGPISHELATEDLPTYRLCGFNNQPLPGGFVRRSVTNKQIDLTVIRDLRIPLHLYQGCASVDIQIEHFNGLVYSANNGTGTGEELSDSHQVMLTLTFQEIDELLPDGPLDTQAVAA